MGRRGPPPKPTALRLLSGERRPSRINRGEPQPPEAEVIPPSYLPADALEVWRARAPDLVRQRLLTSWDVDTFAAYCTAVADMAEARRLIDQGGRLVKSAVFDRNGRQTGFRLLPSPAWRIWRDSAYLVGHLGARFGLSPSDRVGLHLNQPGHPQAAKDPARLLS